ncbi:carbon-nitrogen family hydrolase [Staphylococcus sp. SQ8-PEA]|uniref:Carbon-nitrogen family hydrolase n=1 Tax=Staphylococcus marylandisciuri TaxID=2981529 RepID=A0ABT2QQA5_9STAP|nr:carbon-nitrogen family hydrolase [Staphylococcus marylandisciuri]MCU5746163.1 carbon-nitrogen family hydrolase [Staphylococcus marylandisciuri]
MRLLVLQFKIVPANVQENEDHIYRLFKQHVTEKIDCVVLPEMWNNGYALEDLSELADKNAVRSTQFIRDLAIKYQVDIIAGSISNKKDNGIYNTAFAVNNNGEIINSYDKVHLVPMLNEPEFLNSGQEVPSQFYLSNNAQATQIICYDLRFPELLRYPARNGAQIAFYVAQWPEARKSHWRSLIQARAIENDMFVVGCNSCGDDGETVYAGHSMVVNPNGEIISELTHEEGNIELDLDLNEVTHQRRAIPVFENLRKELYK